MYDLFEQTQITIKSYRPKENEKILLLDIKINSSNDATPSGGHLAYPCKSHRKGEIYRATYILELQALKQQ